MSSKQAIFFVNHWPEPLSSAAGVRTREMTSFLQRMDYQVVGISPQPASEHSLHWQKAGVQTLICDPNQSAIEEQLRILSPEVVVYDRFFMEEQFGWRARELWPQALHIVDTSDLHCLRRARQRAAELRQSWPEVMNPSEELFEEDILRELAALHRADITLVVSTFEEQWLIQQGFEAERILCLPFSADPVEAPRTREGRHGFCFLGNYLHAPNLDAVKWLEAELWPTLRARIPKVELHLYGAYPPQVVSRHKGKDGIFCHGPVVDHRAALAQHEVLVAPLRYGAGIKGKVLEAWATGTPVLGTPITFEGLPGYHREFLDAEGFAEQARLLLEPGPWQVEVAQGQQILRASFTSEILFAKFSAFLKQSLQTPLRWRSSLTGRMLRHHGSQSVKYLSRWIEEKNKKL